MAKDYFQDIVPPDGGDVEQHIPIHTNEDAPPTRSIRNISAPQRHRPYSGAQNARVPDDMHETSHNSPRRRTSRVWIWVIAALFLVILGGLALLALRPTTVSVIPKSRPATLSDSAFFVARPVTSISTSSGFLSYTVQTVEIEDSEVVPSAGTVRVETKASGSITVYNNYSSTPVRLLKNTRFETPEGLVFRTPAEIVIPGKGAQPGEVKVTVIADKAGEGYNVGPVSRFTLPGLKSGAMYTQVYAKSSAAMTGGFIGDQPGTAPGAVNAAISAVRARLETKSREAPINSIDGTIIFPSLISITFQSLPNTVEAGAGVRIHEKAIIRIPLLSLDSLADEVARLSGESSGTSIVLEPGKDFSARSASTSVPNLGVDNLTFSLAGTANLVWQVDASAIAEALKGRESASFQTIVNTFAGVQEARAKIQPFWKKSFPANASDIKVVIVEPQTK